MTEDNEPDPKTVLTLAILEANHYNNWEPALTYPLPPEPSIDLIDTAIDEVLNFLSFVTEQVAQRDVAQARREIGRAATRLTELSEAKPKAFSAWLQEGEQKLLLKKFHTETQHQEGAPRPHGPALFLSLVKGKLCDSSQTR
jgi:hypothetical protein